MAVTVEPGDEVGKIFDRHPKPLFAFLDLVDVAPDGKHGNRLAAGIELRIKSSICL
jgi:hypothetical protein